MQPGSDEQYAPWSLGIWQGRTGRDAILNGHGFPATKFPDPGGSPVDWMPRLHFAHGLEVEHP